MKYGNHRRANQGFGFEHIWYEHSHDILERGYPSEAPIEQTALYVADILQPGAKLYCEFASHTNEKITVLKNSIGIAVIQQRYTASNETFYSVITAFKRRQAHGQLIGSLK